MLDRRALLGAAAAILSLTEPATAQAPRRPSSFPLPRELVQPISFAWSGQLAGAARALAARLGYAAWVNMSTGLPIPDPPPDVPVSVGFAAASPAEIVEALNRAVSSRAVVVLDPFKRFIGVVYYG